MLRPSRLIALLAVAGAGCFDASAGGDGGGVVTQDAASGDARPPTPETPGETCETAPTIPVGTTLGSTTDMVDDYRTTADTCVDAGTAGPDGVYKIDVPAGQRVTLTLTPGDGQDTQLFLATRAQCDLLTTCLAGSDTGTFAEIDAVSYWNREPAAVTGYVIVDGYQETHEGQFTLDARLDPGPRGEACDDPIVLTTDGRVYALTTEGFQHDAITCPEATVLVDGPDVVFAVDVAAGASYDVHVTPGAGLDPSLLVIDPEQGGACAADARRCSAAEPPMGLGNPTSARIPGGGARRLLVVVETPRTARAGAFTVQVTGRR